LDGFRAGIYQGHAARWRGVFNREGQGPRAAAKFLGDVCGPRRAEMSGIDAYATQHCAQGFTVLALSVDELADEGKVREAANPFSFPLAMMKTAQMSGFCRIWRMPVSAVFDRTGRLVKQD